MQAIRSAGFGATSATRTKLGLHRSLTPRPPGAAPSPSSRLPLHEIAGRVDCEMAEALVAAQDHRVDAQNFTLRIDQWTHRNCRAASSASLRITATEWPPCVLRLYPQRSPQPAVTESLAPKGGRMRNQLTHVGAGCPQA